MTKFEMLGLALANEVENCIRTGVPLTHTTVNTLNEFRKCQFTLGIGNDLDGMYKTVATDLCPVIYLASKRSHLRFVKK